MEPGTSCSDQTLDWRLLPVSSYRDAEVGVLSNYSSACQDHPSVLDTCIVVRTGDAKKSAQAVLRICKAQMEPNSLISQPIHFTTTSMVRVHVVGNEQSTYLSLWQHLKCAPYTFGTNY